MSKEIDVKREMWKLAHALEAKAFDANDVAAMNEAVEQKGRLALAIAMERDADATAAPQEGFKPGNGVHGSLAGTAGALADVGVRQDG